MEKWLNGSIGIVECIFNDLTIQLFIYLTSPIDKEGK